MFARMFTALLLSAFALAPFSASAGRFTTPEEDAARKEENTLRFLRRISPELPQFLGDHAPVLKLEYSRRRCNDSGHPNVSGKFSCSEYTSGVDSSRWKFVHELNTQRDQKILYVLRLRSGTWFTHVTVVGNKVTSASPEARKYAQGGNHGGQNRAANDQNPLDKAVGEFNRALGAAIPGKGQQPLQLPPIFR